MNASLIKPRTERHNWNKTDKLGLVQLVLYVAVYMRLKGVSHPREQFA